MVNKLYLSKFIGGAYFMYNMLEYDIVWVPFKNICI